MMPVYSPRGNTHGLFSDMTQGGQYESYNQQPYQGELVSLYSVCVSGL